MTFREVETLAHEFGHALQHMLTTQEEGMVAGINGIEWDAVEVASQVCGCCGENMCHKALQHHALQYPVYGKLLL